MDVYRVLSLENDMHLKVNIGCSYGHPHEVYNKQPGVLFFCHRDLAYSSVRRSFFVGIDSKASYIVLTVRNHHGKEK